MIISIFVSRAPVYLSLKIRLVKSFLKSMKVVVRIRSMTKLPFFLDQFIFYNFLNMYQLIAHRQITCRIRQAQQTTE